MKRKERAKKQKSPLDSRLSVERSYRQRGPNRAPYSHAASCYFPLRCNHSYTATLISSETPVSRCPCALSWRTGDTVEGALRVLRKHFNKAELGEIWEDLGRG